MTQQQGLGPSETAVVHTQGMIAAVKIINATIAIEDPGINLGMIAAVKIINATIAIEDPGINLDNELTCLHSLPRFVFSLSY
jgi:hypothetical protein